MRLAPVILVLAKELALGRSPHPSPVVFLRLCCACLFYHFFFAGLVLLLDLDLAVCMGLGLCCMLSYDFARLSILPDSVVCSLRELFVLCGFAWFSSQSI